MKIDLQLWYINRSVTRGTPTPRRFSHNSGVIEGLFDLNDRFSGIHIAEEIMLDVMHEYDVQWLMKHWTQSCLEPITTSNHEANGFNLSHLIKD